MSRPPAAEADGRTWAPFLRGAVLLLGVSLLASWLLLVGVHVDDRYNAGWVEGTRMALARSAGQGELFPPLYDGERYGGTRFMPVPIVLHAGAAAFTGEYLVSGKLIAFASMALLLGTTFFVLRRMEVATPLAVCLTAGILATRPGMLAGTTVQGDGLSVALQLAAAATIALSTRRDVTLGAAALCVLAILCKLSAVWAPLAIGVWLLARDRRRLALFVGGFAALLVAAFALLVLVTEGRVVDNLVALSFAGIEGTSDILASPLRALRLALDGAPLLLILLPVALVAEPLLAGASRLSIYYVALFAALVSLIVVLSDTGTSHNHLLDLTVLTMVVVGRASTLTGRRARTIPHQPAIVMVLVAVAVGLSALRNVAPDLRAAAAAVVNGTPTPTQDGELARLIGPTDSVLAEDPYVPVSLGRTAIVLDAWALPRMARPEWLDELTARIEAHEFDTILLVYPLSFRAWYSEIHLGDTVAGAIREAYRPAGTRAGYFVYVPDLADGTGAAG